jgi:hypothetical protein
MSYSYQNFAHGFCKNSARRFVRAGCQRGTNPLETGLISQISLRYNFNMILPNVARAIVDIEKLRDYCLSESHPRGKHKARVFATTLGLTATDVFELREAILSAVQVEEAIAGERDEYGQRYIVDFSMRRQGREAVVRSAWIVRRGEDAPRLTSCYVL